MPHPVGLSLALLLMLRSIPEVPSRHTQVGLFCPTPATARAETVTVELWLRMLMKLVGMGWETTA